MPNSHHYNILVVDDDSVTRKLLRQVLAAVGYTVLEAESGEEALRLVQQTAVDGILMDIGMPGMGGIETCRAVRELETHRVTPILFVSAADEPAKLREAFQAGCDDFVHKPINAVILEARLHGHLQRAGYYHQLESVRRNLSRYISPRSQEMAEQYARTGALPPASEHEVCIMFTDIREFTARSQEFDARFLFSVLSQHLGEQVDLVYRHGGYVDKFAGDGIMAVFEGGGRAARACHCALDIIDVARDTLDTDAQRLLNVGIGIHDGRVIAGNIGSADHLVHSVIGNTVNLAARLCGYADPMTIVVSDVVQATTTDDDTINLVGGKRVDIRGLKQPVMIHLLSRRR